MNEIMFIIEQAPEGGYTARALGESIFTEVDNRDSLHGQVRDAVRCHFDAGQAPRLIRLRFTHEEMIAIQDFRETSWARLETLAQTLRWSLRFADLASGLLALGFGLGLQR